MTYRAFLHRLSEGGYLQSIVQGLAWIAFGDLVSKDSRVFVKPNLTFPTYRRGVMTSPEAIEAALLAIKDYTSHIYIGDSDSGGYNRFPMDEVYQATGLSAIAQRLGVQIVNLSKLERKPISFTYRRRRFDLALPRLLTDQIDLLVTMPVPKVHSNTGVSLTFKNQWGCIPENADRLRLHPYFQHVILEVNAAVRAKVAIIDGKYGLNLNGPMSGEPVDLDWILVANDIGAGAALACELMQVPVASIRHLAYAKQAGYVPELDEIETNQDLRPFIRDRFVLRRKLTDYPGYLAFHSPAIARLAYFSPLSDLLHRVLYLFREPFYDYGHRGQS